MEEKNKKYILGGGIAGLIFAYYNDDYSIISENIGGQFSASFPLGPRLLEADEYSRKLLKDLEISAEFKKAKIGYYYDDKINYILEPKLKKMYIEKSRGEEVEDETAVNCSKSEMNYYDIDINKIVEKLKEKLKDRIICKKILIIDIDNKTIELADEIINYESIVSTIPKNIFYKLCGVENNLKSKSITYCLLDKHNYIIDDCNFAYFPEKRYVFHRMTKVYDNSIVVELFGEYSKEELSNIFTDSYVDSIQLRSAQIISKQDEMVFEDVKFLGRYGAWDRSYKINKVIKESI